MRGLGFGLLLAGLLLIAGSAFLHFQGELVGEVPDEVLAVERTLARPGLIGLVTLDVAALVELGVAEEGAEDDGWDREMLAAGIDPRRDLRHATLALTAGDGGEAETAVALFGRFDPQTIARALREREDLTVEDATASSGDAVLHVTRIDRETCEPSGPWAVHLAPTRILAAQPASIGVLLAGDTPTSQGAQRDLARFQRFRGGQLVSAAFFVPEELPDTGNPIVGMAAYGAKQQVEGFRALYAGAAPRLVPPGVALDALLEGTQAGIAAEKVAAWQAWLDEKLGGLGEKLPTIAMLHGALELRSEGNDLHASFRLSKDELERLEKLPEEMGSLIFGGGSGVSFEMSGGDAPVEERLEDSPVRFRPQVVKADLAPYDPRVTFAEPVDRTAGPFGLRLGAIRLGPGDAPAELEIEAFATKVPNLGDSPDRVSLRISGVEGRDGAALLAREHCGADRNDLPAMLSNHFGGDVLRGSKAVRLVEGAVPGDVARVVGTASVRLPTRTEVVKLEAKPDQVERGGARLEIEKVGGGSVSYAVSGEEANLLSLRALNAAGKALDDNGSSSFGGFGGRSANALFAGEIASLEAVFSLEEETIEYAFELVELRPGTSGEMLSATEPGALVDVARSGKLEDWLARMARAAGKIEKSAVAWSGGAAPEAETSAGPFGLKLEGLWSFGGLMPRIGVEVAPIPGLEGSANAVELRLEALRLLDGSHRAGPWSQALALREGFGTEALAATVQIETGSDVEKEQVASLEGTLVVRLPASARFHRWSPVELGSVHETPELSVRLVELARDRFVLRASRGGERVLSARAFNASGEALWTESGGVESDEDGATRLAFQVKGVPERIELRLAEELAQAEYPFRLTLGDRTLARAR